MPSDKHGDVPAVYQVVILKYATRATVRSEVFLHHHLYGEPDGPIDMDYYVWVVRNASHTVLIDTGFAEAAGRARGRTPLVDPVAVLQHLGVDARTLETVVVTHAHYDHIGNLAAFPAATVVMARAERDFWHSQASGHPLFSTSVEAGELAILDEVERAGRLRMFDGSLQLYPGIELVVVGGHTPGQLVVKVDTSSGVVLLASDAVHYREELDRDMPFAIVADLPAMYEAFARIRDLRASGDVDVVVPGHDPDVLPLFDRFVGTGMPRPDLLATIGRFDQESAA